MFRYKVGYYDAEGSFYREFDHPEELSADQLRAHVAAAAAVVAEADRAKWNAIVVEEKAKGKAAAPYAPSSLLDEAWHERINFGDLLYTDDFRDAMLVRGFQESEYVAKVALHGWANAFDRPGPDGCRWGEESEDTLAVQAALRERLGIK